MPSTTAAVPWAGWVVMVKVWASSSSGSMTVGVTGGLGEPATAASRALADVGAEFSVLAGTTMILTVPALLASPSVADTSMR